MGGLVGVVAGGGAGRDVGGVSSIVAVRYGDSRGWWGIERGSLERRWAGRRVGRVFNTRAAAEKEAKSES